MLDNTINKTLGSIHRSEALCLQVASVADPFQTLRCVHNNMGKSLKMLGSYSPAMGTAHPLPSLDTLKMNDPHFKLSKFSTKENRNKY